MRVLIVEDDIATRLVLQRFLRDVCPADVAVNGREAVEAFGIALDEGVPYDVVVMDLEMPEMDGQAALRAIREMEKERGVPPGKEARAIITTAHDDQKSVVNAFFKGEATYYLVKPVKCEELLARLEQCSLVPTE